MEPPVYYCKDLPVLPSEDGGSYPDVFNRERNSVMTAEDLKVFLDRWRPIWGLYFPFQRLRRLSEIELSKGQYDLDSLWVCWREYLASGTCSHMLNGTDCHLPHAVCPVPLLEMSMIAHRLDVPEDIVMHRLAGAYAFENPEVMEMHQHL